MLILILALVGVRAWRSRRSRYRWCPGGAGRCLVEAIGRIGSQAALGGALTALSMLVKERSRREWAGRCKLNSLAEKEIRAGTLMIW